MRTCKGCGHEFRRGTMALVVGQGGRTFRSRVCPKCENRGVLVVASLVAPKVENKVVRSDTIDAAIRVLQTYKANALANVLRNPEQQNYFNGRAEGYESAIETLKQTAEGR